MEIQPFLPIAEKFRAVFLDSYAVLKNYKGLIDGVQDTIAKLREKGIAIRILTNDASRSQEQQIESFAKQEITSFKNYEVIAFDSVANDVLQDNITEGKIA